MGVEAPPSLRAGSWLTWASRPWDIRVHLVTCPGSYAHRGFAQSAHELVKEVEVELTALRQRLPNYR